MRVYLWEAGSAEGVTGDHARARALAGRSMLANGAAEAVVEPADFDDAVKSLEAGYVRTTGRRWTARREGRRVVWTPGLMPTPQPKPLLAAS
jgi:hypothetical protein